MSATPLSFSLQDRPVDRLRATIATDEVLGGDDAEAFKEAVRRAVGDEMVLDKAKRTLPVMSSPVVIGKYAGVGVGSYFEFHRSLGLITLGAAILGVCAVALNSSKSLQDEYNAAVTSSMASCVACGASSNEIDVPGSGEPPPVANCPSNCDDVCIGRFGLLQVYGGVCCEHGANTSWPEACSSGCADRYPLRHTFFETENVPDRAIADCIAECVYTCPLYAKLNCQQLPACETQQFESSDFAMGLPLSPLNNAGGTGLFVAAAILVYFVAGDLLLAIRVSKSQQQQDDVSLTPSDFAVHVSRIPDGVTPTEIHALFSKVGPVAECYFVEDVGRASELAERLLVTKRALQRAQSRNKPATPISPGSELVERSAPAALLSKRDKLASLLEAETARPDADFRSGHAVVVFETQAAHEACLSEFSSTFLERCCGSASPAALRGKRLRVSRAPEPEDFQFENLRQARACSPWDLFTLLWANAVFIVMLGLVAAVQVLSAYYSFDLKQRLGGCETARDVFLDNRDCTSISAPLTILGVAVSFLNFMAATLIASNISKRAALGKHRTRTEQLSSTMEKTVFVHCAVSCVLPLIIAIAFEAEDWVTQGMLLDIVSRQILVDCFMSVAKLCLIQAGQHVVRKRAAAKASTKLGLLSASAPPEHDTTQAFNELLKLFNMLLCWFVLVPWAAWAVLGSLLLHGAVQRVLLLRVLRKPGHTGTALARTATKLLRTRIFYGLVFAAVIYARIQNSNLVAGEDQLYLDAIGTHPALLKIRGRVSPIRQMYFLEEFGVSFLTSRVLLIWAWIIPFVLGDELVGILGNLYARGCVQRFAGATSGSSRPHTRGIQLSNCKPKYISSYGPPSRRDWAAEVDYALSNGAATVVASLARRRRAWHDEMHDDFSALELGGVSADRAVKPSEDLGDDVGSHLQDQAPTTVSEVALLDRSTHDDQVSSAVATSPAGVGTEDNVLTVVESQDGTQQ